MNLHFLRRPAAWLTAGTLGLTPWAAQACGDGGIDAEAEGGHVFTAANVGVPFGGIVPFNGGFNLKCLGDEAVVSTVAAGPGGSTAVVQLHGKATGGGGQAHSEASSGVSSGALLGRNTTPAIFADSAAVLKFQLVDASGEPTPAVVRFEILGDGQYIGTSSDGGYAGFNASVRSGASGVVDNHGWYRDTKGVYKPNTPISFLNNQAVPLGVTFGIDYTAGFYGGGNWLQLDLYTFAWGTSSARFGNTASIAGLTVLTPGVHAVLPDGWFTEDAALPGHYTLNALAPVPEPGSALLLAGGLFGLCGLRLRARVAAGSLA